MEPMVAAVEETVVDVDNNNIWNKLANLKTELVGLRVLKQETQSKIPNKLLVCIILFDRRIEPTRRQKRMPQTYKEPQPP